MLETTTNVSSCQLETTEDVRKIIFFARLLIELTSKDGIN